MRPIEKGSWPTKGSKAISKRIFTKWQRAIPHLETRTGKFCHFCEMKVTNALAIEHIKPQSVFPKLASNWNNFLLTCSYCNSHKLARIPSSPYRQNYFWPHLSNTLKAFDFTTACVIIPNRTYLTLAKDIERSKNTIDLYGLDKTNTSEGNSDTRLIERCEAYYFAINRKKEFLEGINTSIIVIIDLAKTKGFFSVWLKVFDDIPAVKKALIDCPEFHLNSTNCFDADCNLNNRANEEI